MRRVGVSLPESYVKGLEQLVKEGLYLSTAEAIRIAVKELVAEEAGFDHPTLTRLKWIECVERSEYERRLRRK